jgi:hypothetical protein
MWEAVFGDVGVTLIAVFNAMRAGSGAGGGLRRSKITVRL